MLVLIISFIIALLAFVASGIQWMHESSFTEFNVTDTNGTQILTNQTYDIRWSPNWVCYDYIQDFKNGTVLSAKEKCYSFPSTDAPSGAFNASSFLTISCGIMFLVVILVSILAIRWHKLIQMAISCSVVANIVAIIAAVIFPVGFGEEFNLYPTFEKMLYASDGKTIKTTMVSVPIAIDVCGASAGKYDAGACELDAGYILVMVMAGLALVEFICLIVAKRMIDKGRAVNYDKLGYYYNNI
eukprot:Pgem_evm2s13197